MTTTRTTTVTTTITTTSTSSRGPPAQPTRRTHDTYNSSSTGHQRAETRNPPGWRASRDRQLQSQFFVGRSGGGPRLPDPVNARPTLSVVSMLHNPGTMNAAPPAPAPPPPPLADRGIFAGLTIYVNGLTGTAVPISDHRLKQELAQHGAQISSNLALRTVTHVILGRQSAAGGAAGAGGGLAAGKMEREIAKMRKGVKFVGAEWVTESIKAGKRLPESRFVNLTLAAHGQQSILHLVKPKVGGVEGGCDGSAQDEAVLV